MNRMRVAAGLAAAVVGGGAAGAVATAGSDSPSARAATDLDYLEAPLRGVNGERLGRVVLSERRGAVEVEVNARGLRPGFRAFHLHMNGVCEPPFTSAGGHYSRSGQIHGEHAGDFPSLLVQDDGRARLSFETDTFRLSEARGRAVIVHANRDNYANIPSRYGGPDATTLASGDADPRVGCGVLE